MLHGSRPFGRIPLGPRSKRGVVRKFIFDHKDGKITNGRIVEIYSDASYVASHKENLLESFKNGTLKDLTGSVIVYDVNYIYLGSLNYKDGKLVPGMSMVRPGGQLPSNKMPDHLL